MRMSRRVRRSGRWRRPARWSHPRADADVGGDADLQLQLGTLLYDETRYQEALQAFDRATKTDDPALAHARARARSAPRSRWPSSAWRARKPRSWRKAGRPTPKR